MAQYKTGTVSVTNGSATVTGSGTLWSGEIAAGDLFTIVGDNAWYEVASVGSNTSITLSANYAGTTGSGKSYAISRDFTTRLALPYPQKGDIETASIIKRAFEQIDTETNIATANYSATSAPTANDDSGDGYSIGSWWVNVTSDEAYLCVDATVGAAVWTKISVDVPSEIVSLLAGQSVSMASLTLSGGTANGVLYLNGSKVATSGSALTFDGTTFVVGGTSSPNYKLASYVASGNNGITIGNGSNTGSDYAGLDFYMASAQKAVIYTNNNNLTINASAGSAIFQTGSSEAMRLTSTGLGVGTSSPGTKLAIAQNGGSNNQYIQLVDTQTSGVTWQIANYATNALGMFGLYNATAGAYRLLLSGDGNLGLGVTPSAWGSAYKSLEVNGAVIQASSSNKSQAGFGNNYYHNGTNYIYSTSNYATSYFQNSGAHTWYTAASGTAGDAITFTQAMSLTADGDWLLKTTSKYSSAIATISGGLNGVNQSLALVQTDNTAFHDKIQFANTGGVVGTISTTGSATAYNTSSDYRLKNITGPITKSGAYIDSLNPVEGTWKADGSTFVGLIAHEVQETSRTNVATGVKDGEEMQSMDYSSAEIIANLIAEVKSLRQRVATLEAK